MIFYDVDIHLNNPYIWNWTLFFSDFLLYHFSWGRNMLEQPNDLDLSNENHYPKAPQSFKRKATSPTALAAPAIPWEVIEETQDVLESIVASSLVATALGGSGQMVSEKAGHLTGQAWVHSLCGAAFGVKEKASWKPKGARRVCRCDEPSPCTICL